MWKEEKWDRVNKKETKIIRLTKTFSKIRIQLREYVSDEVDKFKYSYLGVMIASS